MFSVSSFNRVDTEELGTVFRYILTAAAVFMTVTLALRRTVRHLLTRRNIGPNALGRGYPIVGNLPQVSHRIHNTLTERRTTHGDFCRLRLGSWPAVVISGRASIREVFIRHGREVASRPCYHSYSSYADGKSISFQPYSSALKLHRQLTLKTIKNIVESGFAEQIVIRQTIQLVDEWSNRRGIQFYPAKSVTLAVAGGLYSMCYGRQAVLSQNKAFEDLLLQTNPGTELLAFGNPVDLIPWLLCPTGIREKYREFVYRMKSLLRLNDELVSNHQEQQQNGSDHDDIMSAMIEASRDLDGTSGLTQHHLLRTPIEMMSAGSDTSSTTLLWLIYYMVKYPEVQEKVHQEIVRETGSGRTVTSADRRRLPYTESAILEVMRLRAIVPFALPHYSTEDIQLRNGCTIPKHCLVFMNLSSVGRDKDLWEDVDDFRPERFLVTHESGVVSIDDSKAGLFHPFGVGRRRCVGELLGRVQVYLFFVNIVKRVVLRKADSEVLVDEEEFGDVLKPVPYSIVVEDRTQ